MNSDTNRLTLRLEVGFLISKARTQDRLYQQALHKDTPPDRSTSLYWAEVLDKVEDLAIMDHAENFTPDDNSYIDDAGILKSYWTLREWYKLDDLPSN